MNFFSKLAVELEFRAEYDKRNKKQKCGNTKADYADSAFRLLVDRAFGDLAVVIHKSETAEKEHRLDRVRHFLQEALHREGDTFVSLARLVFAVVYDIRKENGLRHEHRCNAYAGDNIADVKRDGNFEYGAEQVHQHVAEYRHNKRELIYPSV